MLPEVDTPLGELERTELVLFRQALAAGCPAVMVAHVRYQALDPEWPASLSASVIAGLLRRRLDFRGLVLSDDLEMAAVRHGWGVGAAAARFLTVGGDLALVCRESEARDEAVAAVARALESGALTPDAASAARGRRAALRRWVERARPRPGIDVIGCAEHCELLAEILGRTGDTQSPGTG